MAEVTLTIGGRHYDVNCRDGEEDHLFRLAALVEEKTTQARQATSGLTEIRQLLFAAIFMADELHELRNKADQAQNAAPSPDDIAKLFAQAEESARANLAKEAENNRMEQAETEKALTAHLDHLTNRIDAITDRLAGNSIAP